MVLAISRRPRRRQIALNVGGGAYGEIEKTHSASVRTCTALVIWSNGSSTRSSSAGVWRPATTNSQPTTSHSSSLPQYGYGYAFMSTGPSTRLADFERHGISKSVFL